VTMINPTGLIAQLKANNLHSPTTESERIFLWHLASSAAGNFSDKLFIELGTMNAISTLFIADGIKIATKHVPNALTPNTIRTVDNYSAYSNNPNNPAIHSHEVNKKLVKDFGHDDVIEVIKGDSIEYLKSLDDKSIAFLFEDSWHVEPHVRSTLEIAIPKMVPNGLIVCHDYCAGHRGVIYAVHDVLEKAPNFGGSGLHETLWWGFMR